MKLFAAIACSLALAGPFLAAQQASRIAIDPGTDQGRLLQSIVEAQDPGKKQELAEKFVREFPNDRLAAWVYGQLQPLYLNQQMYDRVLEVGEKGLAMEPGDPELAHLNLNAAERKKDVELVKKWALITSQNARKIVAAGKQTTEGERKLLDYARQLDIYTDYSLYALALQVEPAQTIDLTETLEKRNPQSQYLPKVYGKYLNALRQTGQNDKALAKAEELAAADPSNEDVLLVAADANLQKRQYDKVLLYAGKLLALLQDKPKPDGLSDAGWQRRRDSLLGLGNWMVGVTQGAQSHFAEADQALRAGLPLVTDPELRGIGLFHLGWANYQLGKAARDKPRMREGLKYTEESAGIKSQVQTQAQRNVEAMRGDVK